MVSPASPNLETEQELIEAAKQGDRNAFGELVKIYYPAAINVVYRMCGDQALAEEAVQEAFIRVWQQIDRYQPRFAFRSWVYRIAINAAIDKLRKERPAEDIETIFLKDGRDSPEAEVEKDERVERVRRAVLGLPDAARAVLVLREYEGLSYADIAAALNIPAGTVMSRLNYARGLLRKMLVDDLEN